jgi:hypothetical protein
MALEGQASSSIDLMVSSQTRQRQDRCLPAARAAHVALMQQAEAEALSVWISNAL